MSTEKLIRRRSAGHILLSGAIAIAPFILPSIAQAAKSKVLHSFNDFNDGYAPDSGVIRGPDGTLYGTTLFGGDYVGSCQVGGCGILYKIMPHGDEVILHDFIPAEGDGPFREPALDSSGNLFVSTCCDGQGGWGIGGGHGAIYKFSPDGTYKVLHSFSGGLDGGSPEGVTVDTKGNVFGVASEKGAYNDGLVYEITAQGQFQVLHAFSGGADDGSFPTGTPMVDDKGNIYGTTQTGGGLCGTVFKVTPKGDEKILLSFRVMDGCRPYAGVVRDSGGNSYVTTYSGGAYDYGTLAKLSPSGHVTVLHSFGAVGDGDGVYSPPTLVENEKGDVEIYGLTEYGGNHDAGIAYKYWNKGHYRVIYNFGDGDSDAYGPSGLLTAGPDGKFYGASTNGGANCQDIGGCGAVFELRTH